MNVGPAPLKIKATTSGWYADETTNDERILNMQYMGGKHRQAKDIRKIIAELRGDRTRYVEPFMGGGSVLAAVAPDFDHAVGADASESLIELWKAVVSDEWHPPVHMTKEVYDAMKRYGSACPLKGWAGYGASYRGKWFGGYNGTVATRDYMAENARGLERKAVILRKHPDLTITHGDYTSHTVNADTVVYCDPPYADTTGYQVVDDFDHGWFWEIAQHWTEMGALVLVHEYTAPEFWVPVHTKARVETMHHGGPSSGARSESLFVYGG